MPHTTDAGNRIASSSRSTDTDVKTERTPLLVGSLNTPTSSIKRGRSQTRRGAFSSSSSGKNAEKSQDTEDVDVENVFSLGPGRPARSSVSGTSSTNNSQGLDDPKITQGAPTQGQECPPRSSTSNESNGGLGFQSHSILPKGIALRLENSGSVARDHLASERTFLAYMRTSLAIVGSGVALVQLFSAAAATSPHGSHHRIEAYIRPLGACTIILGLLVLFMGAARYFTIQAALVKGQFPVARLVTGLIAVLLTALVSVTFAILVSGKLEPKRH